jgi:hypothetical protein
MMRAAAIAIHVAIAYWILEKVLPLVSSNWSSVSEVLSRVLR